MKRQNPLLIICSLKIQPILDRQTPRLRKPERLFVALFGHILAASMFQMNLYDPVKPNFLPAELLEIFKIDCFYLSHGPLGGHLLEFQTHPWAPGHESAMKNKAFTFTFTFIPWALGAQGGIFKIPPGPRGLSKIPPGPQGLSRIPLGPWGV